MYEISGKVALVTGGASGIGLGIVKALLDNNAKGVAIIDIDEKSGKLTLENINEQYGLNKAIFINTDVADRNQFDNAFRLTIDAFQNLDIVVNNAGVGEEKNWKRQIEVNLTGTTTGTILAIENYLPKFKTGSDAIVLNMSSISALKTFSSFPVYSATKCGIVELSRCFGTKVHYERSKVKVIAVCPDVVDTPMMKLDSSAYLNDDYYTILTKEMENTILQDVSFVSKATVQIIKEAENGSVWIIKDNKTPFEVEITHRQLL